MINKTIVERILLVDDSKTLAKLISLKVKSELKIEIDVAYSLSEAELFSKKYSYTLAILDLNLPDAPNGEVVDVMLKKNIPSIVLTGSVDKEFRKVMLKKDIIDYIYKGGIHDIDYLIDIIKRLLKNRHHKVMVVDDSSVFRNRMKKMVGNLFFQVYALAHGEEALLILEENPDIKIIITDYNMPVMDGLELTKAVRKKYTKNQLSIFVLSSTEDSDVSAMFLKQGANDFINKPFSKEEFSCRLNNAIEALENIDTITHYSSRDFLTGLYNRRHFFTVMEPYFIEAVNRDEEFMTAMIDIDNFKSINESYGHDIGDQMIIHVSELLRSNVQYQDVVSRFTGDEFCLVLKETTREKSIEILERIRQRIALTPLVLASGEEVFLTVSIGAALEHDNSLNDTMSEADAQLHHAKTTGKNKVCTV
ncbi:MAG: diguanylate cyclase response regulator [Sulfuricurvum sp. GWF2_44_89]|nr:MULTISPECIES: diguanylate cyclase [unclassified Sulfuricurvum]OHD79349.1 MAG: diguanylate cyclase response regulator [Sulfuricurvum sp. GWF2_44_89]OHD94408.1 MAG: diguanylate cyclase response regulator [Sulfuricurvum sp. RIFOXYD12_FULL_44_77]OHD98496.1 MAG: diguanylate cyclase response regulator [Sulfuricurvum sp. RIFOXYD2_FULL_44_160]